MDRRNEELVYLRKAFRRERRAATGAWKFFFAVAVLVAVLMAPGGLLLLPEHPVTAAVFIGVDFLCGLFGWSDPYGAVPAYSNVFWIILAVACLVLLVSIVMWIAGSRKLRRTDAYLSYRTLRAALRDEADEN